MIDKYEGTKLHRRMWDVKMKEVWNEELEEMKEEQVKWWQYSLKEWIGQPCQRICVCQRWNTHLQGGLGCISVFLSSQFETRHKQIQNLNEELKKKNIKLKYFKHTTFKACHCFYLTPHHQQLTFSISKYCIWSFAHLFFYFVLSVKSSFHCIKKFILIYETVWTLLPMK